MQLFAPIWLEEIQSNKIYKKYSERNQKVEESKLRAKEEEEAGKTTSKEVDENEDDMKENTKEMEETEHTENSRTESDQDC